jgi:hypothetical protein
LSPQKHVNRSDFIPRSRVPPRASTAGTNHHQAAVIVWVGNDGVCFGCGVYRCQTRLAPPVEQQLIIKRFHFSENIAPPSYLFNKTLAPKRSSSRCAALLTLRHDLCRVPRTLRQSHVAIYGNPRYAQTQHRVRAKSRLIRLRLTDRALNPPSELDSLIGDHRPTPNRV